jgi:hypothetical protein
MARSIPFWSRTGATSTTPAVVRLPANWTTLEVFVDALSYVQLGGAFAAPAVASVNGITTISSVGTPTAGTFTAQVVDNGQVLATTSALAYNESAANVKTALIGMTPDFFDTGDITAAGGALPTDITLTWTGVYATAVPAINIVSSVTGGEIRARTSTNAAGNGGYGYAEANSTKTWGAETSGVGSRFLYVAVVASTGNYRVTAFR